MSFVFFYYGRVFSSAAFATRVVEVHCEKCGSKYYYRLTRIGTGRATGVMESGRRLARRLGDGSLAGRPGRRYWQTKPSWCPAQIVTGSTKA